MAMKRCMPIVRTNFLEDVRAKRARLFWDCMHMYDDVATPCAWLDRRTLTHPQVQAISLLPPEIQWKEGDRDGDEVTDHD